MGDSTGRILAALQLAAEKHRDQRRKDLEASPYINHPIALASVLWAEGGVRDAAGSCRPLPHDTTADTGTTREGVRRRVRDRAARNPDPGTRRPAAGAPR